MSEMQIENAPDLIAALSEFEFEEIATKVEERFERVYNPEKVGTAKVESQMEFKEVSLGWFLVIKRLGLGLWVGHDKPAFESGDLLRINIRKHDRSNNHGVQGRN